MADNARNLRGQDLYGRNFSDANLRDADFADADLTGADLTRADLTGAIFTRATLTHANVTDAYFDDHNELAKNAILAGVTWSTFGLITRNEHLVNARGQRRCWVLLGGAVYI